MEVKLCFSTICYLMLYLANKVSKISQAQMVGRIICSMDSSNALWDKDAGTYNAPAISKIISGKKEVVFKKELETLIIDIPNIAEKFKASLGEWFSDNTQQSLTQMILELLKKDVETNQNNDSIFSFEKIFGCKKEAIDIDQLELSNLLIKTYLYTTSRPFIEQHKSYISELYKSMSTNGRKSFKLSENNCITAYINRFENRKNDLLDENTLDETPQTFTNDVSKTESPPSCNMSIPFEYKQCRFCKHIQRSNSSDAKKGFCLLCSKFVQINKIVDCEGFEVELTDELYNNYGIIPTLNYTKLEKQYNITFSEPNTYFYDDTNDEYAMCHSCVFWKKINEDCLSQFSCYSNFNNPYAEDEGFCLHLSEKKEGVYIAEDCSAFTRKTKNSNGECDNE